MSAPTVERLYKSLYTTTFNKVVCVGKNYALHVKEMGGAAPPKKPLIFDKPLSMIIKSGEILYLRRRRRIATLRVRKYVNTIIWFHCG